MATHESDCRNLVRRLFANNKGALRFGIEADDVWHETFRRLSQSDRSFDCLSELFGLVKTVASRIVCDKARRYALRKPLFEKPENPGVGDYFEDPIDSHHSPDEAVLSEEQITLLRDVVASDPAAEAVFYTVCELIDSNVTASIANISRHMGLPYSRVRKAHLKLQRLIQAATLNGRIAGVTRWR